MKPKQSHVRAAALWALILALLLSLSSCSATALFEWILDLDVSLPSATDTTPEVTQQETDESFSQPDPTCHHVYGEWKTVTPPTCTEQGSAIRICTRCNGTEEGVYEAKGHLEVPMETVPATCSVGGSTGGTRCSRCNLELTPPQLSLPAGHSEFANGLCIACGTPQNSAEGLAYLDLYNGTYGYEQLASTEKGAAKQTLYRDLDQAVRRFHTDPTVAVTGENVAHAIRYADYGLTLDEAISVWKVYRDDNPLYYWISNSISYNDHLLNVIAVEDYASGNARIEQNRLIYSAITSYLSLIPANATDYQRALAMHDAILAAIDYAYDGQGQPRNDHWAHSIVGVFDKKGAVCEGFAKAFQLLMNVADVPCIYVTGIGSTEAHAWNLLQLEGRWYGVDVTWNDNNEGSSAYLYFCISADAMAEKHTPDQPSGKGMDYLYPLPALSESGLEWVRAYKNGQLMGLYTDLDSAFAQMTDPYGTYRVELGGGNELYHTPRRYYIRGRLPQVRELTVQGQHAMREGGSFTATEVYLTQSLSLNGKLILRSVFLSAEKPVTLKTGQYSLVAKNDNVYYSAVLEKVTVIQ